MKPMTITLRHNATGEYVCPWARTLAEAAREAGTLPKMGWRGKGRKKRAERPERTAQS